MKSRFVLAALCCAVLGITGCGSKGTVDSAEALEEIREEGRGNSEENYSSVDSNASIGESVDTVTNSKEFCEVSLGLGSGSVCRVRIPSGWLISGYGYNESGEKDDTLLNGTTLSKEKDRMNLDKIALEYALVSGKGANLRYEIYSTELGDISVEKQNNPDGIEYTLQGRECYVYRDANSASDGLTPVCMAVEVSEDAIVIVRYGGPLEDEKLEDVAKRLQEVLILE